MILLCCSAPTVHHISRRFTALCLHAVDGFAFSRSRTARSHYCGEIIAGDTEPANELAQHRFLAEDRSTQLCTPTHRIQKAFMTGSTVKRDLQVSPSVKSTDTPDGVVLLDIHGGMCFPLDQVGTFIWKRLEQRLEIGIIAQQIASAYQIPIQQATTDLHEFLQQLQASRLLLGANRQEHSKRLPWTSALGHFCRWLTGQRNISRGA